MIRPHLQKRGLQAMALALVALLAAVALTQRTPAVAQASTERWITCDPVGVATYAHTRLHVECHNTVNGVRFFALSTSDAADAGRVLSVITMAQVAGRTLNILYDPSDQSGASIGCQAKDCRLIRAVGFGR